MSEMKIVNKGKEISFVAATFWFAADFTEYFVPISCQNNEGCNFEG